ncbi:hypothetical protein Vadar_020419 [Vaccinium darrowii]|uniref:Uncharacterized protein n=1 Tax=Vaccinium darrowii TaxID=229202 RepID=A0ACB7YQB0_9ERIC|nr:hypothetical protein Vadar_020419 [Vaccinium darrowii]
MTTTSAANSSWKFNKRLRPTSSRSAGFVKDDHQVVQDHPKSLAGCDDRRHGHTKLMEEEIKKVSITTSDVLKEKVKYKECGKNHVASIGGYAVDGCREFMPAGEEGTAAAFKCAACSCHRNFHRKEAECNDCYCDCSSISATTK